MFTSVVKIGMFRLFLVLPLLALADDEAIRLNNLGTLHLQRGGYVKAEEYFKASLRAFEATKPDSPEAATTMANLGETYRLTGRLRDSEIWYSRAIDVREKSLGPEHPLTANVLSAMACLRLDFGQPAAAERLMHRAISIRERAGVTNDQHFLAMLLNLAEALRGRKDWPGAEQAITRSLALRLERSGEDSLEYATGLHHMAALRQDQGNTEEAYNLYLRALEIRTRKVGDSHPLLVPTVNNLASLCLRRGDLEEAKSHAEHVVRILGAAEVPNLASALMNMAEIAIAMGDYVSAEPLYRRAVDIWEKAAPGHPRYASCLLNFSRLYVLQGRYAAAENVLRRALSIAEDEQTKSTLAFVLRLQGRNTEAGRLQKSFKP
jgi:tetratricopeptide (TPR) repeat protein